MTIAARPVGVVLLQLRHMLHMLYTAGTSAELALYTCWYTSCNTRHMLVHGGYFRGCTWTHLEPALQNTIHDTRTHVFVLWYYYKICM
jgi:hypothetical protein